MIILNFVASSCFIESTNSASKECTIMVIILKSWRRKMKILHEISSRTYWMQCCLITINKQEHNLGGLV